MFIKTLSIKNFKCFGNNITSLDFNIPDGQNPGSGLNIFVGDNNAGKSTIFESIDFLRDNTSKDISIIKNKNTSNENEVSAEVIFAGDIENVIENFSQANKKDVFKKYIYENEHHEKNLKILRSSENIKSLQLWNNDELVFKNESGIDAPLKKLFETNFVWSDTNPNTQASFGATTVCGNLLKEIVKNFEQTDEYSNFSTQFHETFNKEDSGFKREVKEIEEKTQRIFSEQFCNANVSFHFDELKIDSFLKNTKVQIDDGINTFLEEKGSGMQRSVALALVQVYADELIKHPENGSLTKPFFLFIDEPEICLHPKAQLKLLSALVKLSKTKQIFIATHSPYFFKHSSIKNSGLFLFKKNGSQVVSVEKLTPNWGSLPWSPSWGEINFYAYGMPTLEFHNELYGHVQNQSSIQNITAFDNYLQQAENISEIKPYIRGGVTHNITLCSYVRNQIHHPDNTDNPKFTDDELKKSIELLLGCF